MDEFTYITAFAVGLMGGVHCVGMCGGIVGALSFANQQNKNSESVSNWSVLLGYNFGRLLSYTLLGGLAGLLASAFLGVWSDVHFYQMSLKGFLIRLLF